MILANWLMKRAMRLMPSFRAEWSQAMQHEFEVTSASDRLGFAAGCLWAAIIARIDLLQILVIAGRLGVGTITAAFGIFQLSNLANVLSAPAYYAHHSSLTMPWLAAYLAATGSGNAIAGLFLAWWRPKPFMFGWAIVAVTQVALTVWCIPQTHPNQWPFWAWQFVPLALLATGASLLTWAGNIKPNEKAAS